MSMEDIRNFYGINVKRGSKIIYTGNGYPQQGVVVGSIGGYLRIKINEKIFTYHPTWKIDIVDCGSKTP